MRGRPRRGRARCRGDRAPRGAARRAAGDDGATDAPVKQRSLVGAWCFADHYGPDRVADTGGMSVAPHPHTGLQTVSWLFTGEIEHRDSGGHHAMVRPGELNLMTAGRGISHSEVSTAATTCCTACSCGWPCPTTRGTASRRSSTTPRRRSPATAGRRGSSSARCSASTSPVATASPLLGAELVLGPGAALSLDVDASYEHGRPRRPRVGLDGGRGDRLGRSRVRRARPHALSTWSPGRTARAWCCSAARPSASRS